MSNVLQKAAKFVWNGLTGKSSRDNQFQAGASNAVAKIGINPLYESRGNKGVMNQNPLWDPNAQSTPARRPAANRSVTTARPAAPIVVKRNATVARGTKLDPVENAASKLKTKRSAKNEKIDWLELPTYNPSYSVGSDVKL